LNIATEKVRDYKRFYAVVLQHIELELEKRNYGRAAAQEEPAFRSN
jgi:hypothetical protein